MTTQTHRGAAQFLSAIRFGFAIAAALGAAGASAAITVGPDADPNCQFHDVTSAVISADQSPGLDLVQISAGTYTGVSTITLTSGDDLIVEGGFADCSAGISTGTSTLDANGAVIHGSLFEHLGAGKLTLLHLVLQGGDAVTGGGVDSQGSGALVLSDVMLANNFADYGGGLYVVGAPSPHKQVTLIGTQFNSNAAHGDGGGLYALFADITIDGSRPSYFLGNFANGTVSNGDGGGAYLLNSNLHARTHGVFGFPFIGSNIAHRYGGGIYFGAVTPNNYELYLENDRANEPLEVSDNAGIAGGGIYFDANSSDQINTFAHFRNTIWRSNDALYGAAVHAESVGNGSFGVSTIIHFEQTAVGDAAPPCPFGMRCNLLEGNLAHTGYIISASAGGPGGYTAIYFNRGSMISNDTVGGGGGLIFCGGCTLQADGSLFAQNTLSGDLMGVVDGDLRFWNSTVANNIFGADQLFTVALVPSTLEITHSLLTQPNDPVDGYLVGTSIPVTVHDLGVDSVNVTGTNVQFLSDPYVDAAGGDFHIRTTSSAVDRWAASSDPTDPAPTLDLDGALRPHVFNSPSEPFDFGAYEAGSQRDAIFINGFD
jgi:hypothetical protein